MSFRINPVLDLPALHRAYSRSGRVFIDSFLHNEDALALHEYLRAAATWTLVFNSGDKLFELDRASQGQMEPAARSQLQMAIQNAARYDFQFCFENIRVPDDEEERRSQAGLLNSFASFMSSNAVISIFRKITGAAQIDFADAQATAYGPGHFLTSHDDLVPEKNRIAAYVFGMTPSWSVDWGGLLLFHDGRRVSEALIPQFNSISIFRVPQPHSVSMIAPFAANRRYSVTGWLRSRAHAAEAPTQS